MVAFPGSLDSGRVNLASPSERTGPANQKVEEAETRPSVASSTLGISDHASSSSGVQSRQAADPVQKSQTAENNVNSSDRQREQEVVERRLSLQSEQQRNRIEQQSSRPPDEPSRATERRAEAAEDREAEAIAEESAEAAAASREAIASATVSESDAADIATETEAVNASREDTSLEPESNEQSAQSFGGSNQTQQAVAESQQQAQVENREQALRSEQQVQSDDGIAYSKPSDDEMLGTNVNAFA